VRHLSVALATSHSRKSRVGNNPPEGFLSAPIGSGEEVPSGLRCGVNSFAIGRGLVARGPGDEEQQVEGGDAAERRRQFLRERFGEEDLPIPEEESSEDEQPSKEEDESNSNESDEDQTDDD
jgi:hypothetical protein